MKYYVENWDTEEVIAEFNTEEERKAWFKNNATLKPNDGAYLEDGTHIAFYEW